MLLKYFLLFLLGGCLYYLIETLWRGYSFGSMFILGGVCFVAVGLINEILPWDLGLVWQMLLGAVTITELELLTGIIVNGWLGMNVWDYSDLPFNFLGQICLQFFFAWFGISGVGIVLDDWVRYWFFGEERPRYTVL